MEKKRRDRINRCLDELKDLMSQADDKARYQKMEKAEILEMAVTYMKNMKSSQTNENSNSMQEANHQAYYTMAFQQCLNEFQNFLNVFPGVKDDFKSRIMSYMSQRYIELTSQTQGLNDSTSKKCKQSARYSPYSNRQSPNKRQKMSNQSEEQSNSLFYQQNSKFGGSCSSLDSFMGGLNQPNSPSCESEINRSNLSSNSSPALSECSSPVSSSKKSDLNTSASLSFSNFDLYQNSSVWRPW